jgi:hypothetical protein
MKLSLLIRGGLALALALTLLSGIGSSPARASQTFSFQGNNNVANPVDATAVFTITAGQVVVTITNNLTTLNGFADNQTINGVNFTLSTSISSVTGNLTANPGTFININNSGTVTPASPGLPWGSKNTGSNVEISSLLAGNGAGGAPTIIWTAANYSGANNSIKNESHNPWLQGSATFTVLISGLSANAVINSMQFEFGTAAGDNTNGVPHVTAVPEPGTYGMALSAVGMLFGLGVWRRRRLMTA